MNIEQLHCKLRNESISSDDYYLHGLYGSSDDNDKWSLRIYRGKYSIKYQVYFKERGSPQSVQEFSVESDACEYIFEKLKDEKIFRDINDIKGLSGMTVNERLWASGFMDEFDKAKIKDKNRAKQILRWLRVDEPSINLTIQ